MSRASFSPDREVEPQQRKTTSMTFRLDSSVVDQLQEEADNREVSLNVFVGQILRRYRDWDRFETKIGIMPVPKVILSSLIDRTIEVARKNGIMDIEPYREQIVKQAAQIAFLLMKDEVLFMKKSFNLWTLLSVLQEYMKASDINSDHKIEPGGRQVFIIQHDLGDSWSIFTKELMGMIFEDLARVRADISTTPNTVVAQVILR